MSHTPVAPSEATHHLMIMAYGGADKLDDVRPYLMDVRNYRVLAYEVVNEITEPDARESL